MLFQKKNQVWIWTFSAEFLSILDLHMPVTINSFKKYINEITPVYMSTEIHVFA
jgi:hypothetical protein